MTDRLPLFDLPASRATDPPESRQAEREITEGCNHSNSRKMGKRDGRQRYICKLCGHRWTEGSRYQNGRTVQFRSEYGSYRAMMYRCHRCKPHMHTFKHYRSKGVVVCDRWRYGENGKSGFECFLHDMGRRPSLLHTIDRFPNSRGNYEPGNCRWATVAQQAANMQRQKTSRYLGVYRRSDSRVWRAKIRVNGRNKQIGVSYKSAILAALAYDDEAFELRGSDALLNFPERYRKAC